MHLSHILTLLQLPQEPVHWFSIGLVNLSTVSLSVALGMTLGKYRAKVDSLEKGHGVSCIQKEAIKLLQEELKGMREDLSENREILGRVSGMMEVMSKDLGK